MALANPPYDLSFPNPPPENQQRPARFKPTRRAAERRVRYPCHSPHTHQTTTTTTTTTTIQNQRNRFGSDDHNDSLARATDVTTPYRHYRAQQFRFAMPKAIRVSDRSRNADRNLDLRNKQIASISVPHKTICETCVARRAKQPSASRTEIAASITSWHAIDAFSSMCHVRARSSPRTACLSSFIDNVNQRPPRPDSPKIPSNFLLC